MWLTIQNFQTFTTLTLLLAMFAASVYALPVEDREESVLFAVEPVRPNELYQAGNAKDLELVLSPLTQGLVETGSNRFRRSAEPLGFGSPDPVSNKHRFRVKRIKLCYGGFYC